MKSSNRKMKLTLLFVLGAIATTKVSASGDVLLILSEVDIKALRLSHAGVAEASCEVSPQLPPAASFAATLPVFFQHEGQPVVCSDYSGECFSLAEGSQSWQSLATMTVERKGGAVMDIDGYILVTGGSASAQGVLSSTDFWDSSNEAFAPGPELPIPVYRHCVATVDSNRALLTGGYHNEALTAVYMFNKEAEEGAQWTEMQSLQAKRYGHACGRLGSFKVVVAGGHDEFDYLSSVEVFDVQTLAWSQGQSLPSPVGVASSLQMESTFLFVESRAPNTLSVYEYDNSADNWTAKETSALRSTFGHPALFRLPAQYLGCCNNKNEA